MEAGWYDPGFIVFALCVGYTLGVMLETPVLALGLSACHSLKSRVQAGLLLTLCTYPFVIVVMPRLINPDLHKALYLAVTETLVPIAECAVFWFVFHRKLMANASTALKQSVIIRDFAVIIAANLFSFGVGELIAYWMGQA